MAGDQQTNGLSRGWAAGFALGAVSLALLAGSRAGPTPDNPNTRRWYRRLRKPNFTPPSAIYPIAWTAIQTGLAYGGYRLLRAEPSSQRTTALALWSANQIGIGGWTEVFFGRRAPGWGTVASAALGVRCCRRKGGQDRLARRRTAGCVGRFCDLAVRGNLAAE
jgi:benzodiazapine receptor